MFRIVFKNFQYASSRTSLIKSTLIKTSIQPFHSTLLRLADGDEPKNTNPKNISLTFEFANGDIIQTKARLGETLLDVVLDNDLNIDGFGACEGTCSCSSCHLIFSEKDFKILGIPEDDEMDMLDMAYDITDTSRLGCQVRVKQVMDGIVIRVPETINDARV